MAFFTDRGDEIPALTSEQMQVVDQIAICEFNLGILQLMENAGRSLAQLVLSRQSEVNRRVIILSGPGGNGGGGLCSARHLHNHDVEVTIVLSAAIDRLKDATKDQLMILRSMGIRPYDGNDLKSMISSASVVIDALIGYNLKGAPTGRTADLIHLCNNYSQQVISLDVPSGMDATTGESPGESIETQTTLTLALPKTGLERFKGEIYLADIGIPPELYSSIGILARRIFEDKYLIPIHIR